MPLKLMRLTIHWLLGTVLMSTCNTITNDQSVYMVKNVSQMELRLNVVGTVFTILMKYLYFVVLSQMSSVPTLLFYTTVYDFQVSSVNRNITLLVLDAICMYLQTFWCVSVLFSSRTTSNNVACKSGCISGHFRHVTQMSSLIAKCHLNMALLQLSYQYLKCHIYPVFFFNVSWQNKHFNLGTSHRISDFLPMNLGAELIEKRDMSFG